MARTTPNNVSQSQTNINTVSMSIASILHKRGIDKEVAQELSLNHLDEDELLLEMMIQNLEDGCDIVSREEILEYISTAVLHRQNIHLDSYDHLISMVSKIKQMNLDNQTLKALKNIATINRLLLV
jgi:hypothetical protein